MSQRVSVSSIVVRRSRVQGPGSRVQRECQTIKGKAKRVKCLRRPAVSSGGRVLSAQSAKCFIWLIGFPSFRAQRVFAQRVSQQWLKLQGPAAYCKIRICLKRLRRPAEFVKNLSQAQASGVVRKAVP